MKRSIYGKVFVFIFLTLWLSIAAIASAQNRRNTLSINGGSEVWLKRPNWSRYYPTSHGVAVNARDLIWLRQGTAYINCFDGKTRSLSLNRKTRVDSYCPTGESPYDGGIRAPLQGDGDELPYTILPRLKLSQSPTILRWNYVDGVSEYTVEIAEVGWSESVAQPQATNGETPQFVQTIYSGPSLQPGPYHLVVTTDTGLRPSNRATGDGFRIVSAEEQAALNTQLSIAKNPEIDDTIDDLRPIIQVAVATTYDANQFYSEAIQAYEQIEPQSPAILLEIADLYEEFDLEAEAQAAYERVLAVAEEQPDTYSQALAEGTLAKLLNNDPATQQTYLGAAKNTLAEMCEIDNLAKLDDVVDESVIASCTRPSYLGWLTLVVGVLVLAFWFWRRSRHDVS